MEGAWEGHRRGMGGVWRCMGGAYEGDGRTMGWDLLFYLLYWSFALTLFDRTNCPMLEIKLVSLQDAFPLSFHQYPYYCESIWKPFFLSKNC